MNRRFHSSLISTSVDMSQAATRLRQVHVQVPVLKHSTPTLRLQMVIGPGDI